MSLTNVVLAVLPAVGQAADLLTTRKALGVGLREGNPLLRQLVTHKTGFIVVKSVIAAFLVWVTVLLLEASFFTGVLFSIGLTLAGLLPAINNVIQIRKAPKA